MQRDKLLNLLSEQIENKNIIKHMLATEVCMRHLARKLNVANEDEWAFAGLMHDGDYTQSVPVEKQGLEITRILKEKGINVSDTVAYAMAAHNWKNNNIEPKNLIDWSLFCCDSLTGLIVASTLVLPNKKLSELTVEKIMNRFKEKNFAKGTRRDEISMCEEKLGIKLTEFVEICLLAMQEISMDLGL